MSQKKKNNDGAQPFDLDKMWREKTEFIRRYLDQKPNYERLSAEVAYILERSLKNAEIEFASVTQRAKTMNSFLEKIERKTYEDPFADVTDFAGVRVVCLYIDDLPKIEEILDANFQIVEKIDKMNDKNPDQFGYDAVQFIVKLREEQSGARYDDLKDLVCEIQTRTVSQDAWAIIDHHLVYKNTEGTPVEIRRSLNQLSALFGLADKEFSRLKSEREEFRSELKVESKKTPVKFLENELNFDSFLTYAEWKFPDVQMGNIDSSTKWMFENISNSPNYNTLKEIDIAVDKGKPSLQKYLDHISINYKHDLELDRVTLIWQCLLFADKDLRQNILPKALRERLEEHIVNK